MPSTEGFTKLRKTMKIFAVVQFALLALLIYMAISFQAQLQLIGRGHNFMFGVIAASLIQLVLFFPIKKFAAKEADRDLYISSTTLSKEELKAYSKKKRYSDIAKMCTFAFYIIFILSMRSPDPLVLSVIYYSFVLTILTYLQCYNFAAKKLMQEPGAPRK
jgi:hypothetical protein